MKIMSSLAWLLQYVTEWSVMLSSHTGGSTVWCWVWNYRYNVLIIRSTAFVLVFQFHTDVLLILPRLLLWRT